MAWLTKPSATTVIARRPEPYLTPAMKDRLTRDVLPRYETRLGATMPALHMVQEAHGWLPPQALEEIAAFLGLQPADVLDTASFYEEYWLKQKGRHVVAVCRSIACEACDHAKITDACKRRLGVELGETTDDDRFTLIEIECLGSCGTAPVALIDHSLHENLTPESVVRAIDGVKDDHHAHH